MANPSIIVQFQADTSKLTSAVKDVQSSGQGASKALGNVNWKSVAKWGAVTAAAAGTAKLLKSSSDSVTDLAKSTAALQRVTDMDARTASAWIETLKVRNISADTFTTALTRTSKQMDKFSLAQAKADKAAKLYNQTAAQLAPVIAKGGDAGKEATKTLNALGNAADKAQRSADTAALPFTRLGVSLADVRAGHTQAVLLQMADGFAKINNPAEKAALASQLFGRQGLKLLPVLNKGSKALQEQLNMASKYGATISEKTVKSVSKLADEQRQLKLAQDGVKNSIGQALLPAQVSLYGTLLRLVNVLVPITSNVTVMKGVLITAAVAMGAYKAAVIAGTLAEQAWLINGVKVVASWVARTAVTVASTIATWADVAATTAATAATVALDAALSPIGLIVLGIVAAIVALVAIGYELYKHWDDLSKLAGKAWNSIKTTIVNASRAVIQWLRANWPLVVGILGGPFALAIAEIIKNWGKIRGAISDGISSVRGVVLGMSKVVIGWGTTIGAWIKSGVVGGLAGIGTAVWNVVNNIWAVFLNFTRTIIGWGASVGGWIRSGIVGAFAGIGSALERTLKGAFNAIIRAWNKLEIPGFKIGIPHLPKISVPAIKLPNIPLLAQGGIVTSPTLAMVGEAGPEAVIPLRGPGGLNVKVYIGERELKGIVRTEVYDANTRTAQVLLAGAR